MVSLLLAVLLTLLEPLMTFPKRQLLHFHIEIPGILKFSFQVFKHFSFCRFHTLHVSQKIHRQGEWRNLVSDKETKTKPTAVSVYCALSQIVQTEIGIWKNTVQGLWKSQLPFPGQGVMTLRDEVEGLLIQNFAYLEMWMCRQFIWDKRKDSAYFLHFKSSVQNLCSNWLKWKIYPIVCFFTWTKPLILPLKKKKKV